VSAFPTLSHFALIALGGGLGAMARHLVGWGSLRLMGPGFPWGTLCVNVMGSFAMGVLIGAMVKQGTSENIRLFLGVGLLGGFTTFSAFSLDAIRMFETKAYGPFAAYVGASVILSLLAILLGLFLMREMA